MAGLLDVAEMIGMIGAAAKLTAADLREAADAQRSYNEQAAVTGAETTSSMPSAGGGTSSMGASASGPLTAAGMALAVKQNQGRL